MDRKYSVITAFLGDIKDRFTQYQPHREIEEKLALAAKIKGCQGLEVVYPQEIKDPVKLKELLDSYHLRVSAVNLNVKSEQKWRFGSFSHENAEVRKQAIQYLKTAMDYAAILGANKVTTALLNDGSDYPFEIDFVQSFRNVADCLREASEHRSDVKISLEYKASEPRVNCLLNNAGKMAYLCSLVNKSNVGVTLDIGHALQCLEIPADSAAFLGITGKLFYVHVNDNNRSWDWDLVPGSHNFWNQLEFFWYLKRIGYNDWFTADVFPQRYDPIRIMEKTFEWLDFMMDTIEKIDEKVIFNREKTKDAFAALDYVKSLFQERNC